MGRLFRSWKDVAIIVTLAVVIPFALYQVKLLMPGALLLGGVAGAIHRIYVKQRSAG